MLFQITLGYEKLSHVWPERDRIGQVSAGRDRL
jgi:hypothetical protein